MLGLPFQLDLKGCVTWNMWQASHETCYKSLINIRWQGQRIRKFASAVRILFPNPILAGATYYMWHIYLFVSHSSFKEKGIRIGVCPLLSLFSYSISLLQDQKYLLEKLQNKSLSIVRSNGCVDITNQSQLIAERYFQNAGFIWFLLKLT